jgi:hypothetical protein
MFGLLTTQITDRVDPLQSPRVASAWLGQLPPLDVMTRQEHVVRALESMRKSGRAPDRNRIAALEFLDAALGPDRRQLLGQYLTTLDDGKARLADRLWQTLLELTQAFGTAYRSALEHALTQAASPRWKPALPLLFARLVHYGAADTKLRVFRFERWIPGKWLELHDLYARAAELGIERVPTALGNGAPDAARWTVEQEYVFTLLLHQLNTGNLTPRQFDWVSGQFRVWCRGLALEARPTSPDGFVVDLAGRTGLARREGQGESPTTRFLDTTPLVDQLGAGLRVLARAELVDQGTSARLDRERIAALMKVRAAVAPSLGADLRSEARLEVSLAAKVRVGLARICSDFVIGDPETLADIGPATEEIEICAVMPGSRPTRNAAGTGAATSAIDAEWQLRDRSRTGLRIAASADVAASLALGVLVAVRAADAADWAVGIVRRLRKLPNGELEAGIALIAERPVPVMLHAKREAKADMGYVVDGVDYSTRGARFVGLYLPLTSPVAVRTLVVPSIEYSEGGEVILDSGPSEYTIRFRHMVEQGTDWSRVAVQVVSKVAKAG